MSAFPGCEFPNPCPVCGNTDDHADFRAGNPGFGATFCPHPGDRGHGTGCCCAGISRETEWTEEQIAEFRRQFAEVAHQPPRIWPPPPPLGPDEVRQLLRECVTVVKPGESLVVRVPWTTTPGQLREYQRVMDSAEGGQIPFKVLVVAGDELGVVPGNGSSDEDEEPG